MKMILEVTAEYPLRASADATSAVIGTQYDVAEANETEPIAGVVITDEGDSYAATGGGMFPHNTIHFTFESKDGLVDPAEVAVFAAAAVLQPSAETELDLLVALGETEFANV